jgi:iron complex transport system substrate-binding protein
MRWTRTNGDRRARQVLWLALSVVLMTLLAGCDRREGEEVGLPEEAPAPRPIRIVSLAPAITRILVDMGLGSRIVAVGEYDTSAPQGTPVVGNFLEINAEALLATQPSHVITMVGKSGTPENLKDLAAAKSFELVVYPMPNNVESVLQIIFDERELLADHKAQPGQPQSLGSLFTLQKPASELKYRMLMQLAAVEKLVGSRPRPRVLMVLGTQPLMASGPGTVHDGLLRFAGGVNAADAATVGAPIYDREALLATVRPDTVLLLLPQAPPLSDLKQDDRLAIFRDLDVPAVANGRVVLINDPLVLLPSSSMAQITGAMAKAIHPDLAEAIDKVLGLSYAALAAQAAGEPLPTPPAVDVATPTPTTPAATGADSSSNASGG